jgi:hypothetical protein
MESQQQSIFKKIIRILGNSLNNPYRYGRLTSGFEDQKDVRWVIFIFMIAVKFSEEEGDVERNRRTIS